MISAFDFLSIGLCSTGGLVESLPKLNIPVIVPNASPFATLCTKLVVVIIGLQETSNGTSNSITLMAPSFRANLPTVHVRVHG